MSEDSNSEDFQGHSIDSIENKDNNQINSNKNNEQNDNKNLNDDQEEEFKIENNEIPNEPPKNENDSTIEMKSNNLNNENIKEKKEVINLNTGNINNSFSSLKLDRKKDAIIIEIDEEKSKKYTVYQLIEVKNNSNLYLDDITSKSKENKKSILCFRRYSDFDKFYNTLKFRFPHCIFPRLSEKKYFNNTDKKNLEIRRKELQYFINKLYFHEQISKSEEFKHFINTTFDSHYYDNLPKKYSYPECEKVKKDDSYFSLGFKKLKGFFSNTQTHTQSDSEREILNREEEFKNKISKYNELLTELKNLYENTEETRKEYKNISDNILFINGKSDKDNEIEEDDSKTTFNELIDLNQNLSNIYENENKNLLMDIIDQLNYCILDVGGIKRAIERFNDFLKDYEKVKNTKVDNKYVTLEKSKIENDKAEFETSLLNDLKKYDKENEQFYEQIIQNLIIYIKKINEEEMEIFKNSSFN